MLFYYNVVARISNFYLHLSGNVSTDMDKPRLKILYLIIWGAFSGLSAPAQAPDRQGTHKVALVLSGGGARGAAHIGVLRVLEREHIPIDCIAGVSFGALVGGLYAIGYPTDEIERILSGQDWNNFLSDAPERRLTPLIQRGNSRYQAQISLRGWVPELPAGLRGGQKLIESLDLLTTSKMLEAGYDFDKLPIQFRAVATNLIDGKQHIFRQGSMTEAIRASIAVPLLFTPFEKDGMLLADGGLTNNLPTDIARDMGADIIIAVDATSPLLTKDELRNFIDVVDQSISLQMERNVRENRNLASIVLQPRLENLTYNDYDKIPEIVRSGEEEANRALDQLKAWVAGISPRPQPAPLLPPGAAPVIASVSFRGLNKVRAEQLEADVHRHPGEEIDPAAINADVGRLYATRLFDSVAYSLEPAGENRFQLVFIVKESALTTLGVGFRYDNDYDFVALAEFTARQLFHGPSSATISAQFGGLEDYFATLRLIPSFAPFLFLEPRAEVTRLERLDFRDKILVDRFTDKREGGRVLIGGSIFKGLEIAGGYRGERVRINEGTAPNRLAGSVLLAGLTFRLNRDSLDFRDFPRSGTVMRIQIDKRSKSLGGDLDYSKWEADYQRYFSVSDKSTFRINTALGYSRGPVPFYDLYFNGGYSFFQIASRQFLGFERDELTARQMAIVGGGYRRQLFSRAFSFIRGGYLTTIYNGIFFSSQEKSPYNFELLNGASIGMALDTLIGPLRATVGWGEGRRWNFYISFGPAF
jgi:NTE family protein